MGEADPGVQLRLGPESRPQPGLPAPQASVGGGPPPRSVGPPTGRPCDCTRLSGVRDVSVGAADEEGGRSPLQAPPATTLGTLVAQAPVPRQSGSGRTQRARNGAPHLHLVWLGRVGGVLLC